MTEYAEHDGIWHRIRHLDGAGVVTLCDQRIEAEVHELTFTPKPMCWRCREKL